MYKKASLFIGLMALVLFVGAGCRKGDTNGIPTTGTNGDSTVPTTTVTTPATPAANTTTPAKTASKTTPPKTTTPSATPAPTSYVQALNVYRTNGYYFQFVSCHGNPGSLIIKKGAKYMLDNRDKVSHRFVVGGRAYTIKGYGYLILTADRTGDHNITCDGGGAAMIKVLP